MRCNPFVSILTVSLAVAAAPLSAFGQSAVPAVFVANNGNIEGAVTSFTLDSAGRPVFVQKLVTGSGSGAPGNNAYSIDISPGGRFLATSHTTAATTERISIIEVRPDATLALLNTATTPDSPLDLKWISDTLLAATRTQFGGTNQVIVYAVDSESGVLTEVDRGAGGTFTSAIDVHPSGRFLYAGDSDSNFIRVFEIAAGGTLTEIQTEFTGSTYPLGLEVSPDGTRVYAGGGISSGRTAILGYDIGADGRLTAMAGMPFLTSGNSPFNINYSEDGAILFVGHGTDATIRSFLIDPVTGALTETGFVFDVGLQGSFGDSATIGGLLFVTDDTSAIDGLSGLYSFDIQADGSFTATGPIVPTGATTPTEIAVWNPGAVECPADLNGDLEVGLADLAILLSNFGTPGGTEHGDGDIDADGDVDLSDLTLLLSEFGVVCG